MLLLLTMIEMTTGYAAGGPGWIEEDSYRLHRLATARLELIGVDQANALKPTA
jgi:hypothetical protein